MSHVFISYKHGEDDFIEKLEKRIVDNGMETWSDKRLIAGTDWRLAIDNAINDSFAVIVVMTPEARQSEYVTYEWSFAMGMGKDIVPIMLENTKLHPKLEALQYVDFTRQKDSWHKLIKTLKDIKQNMRQPTIILPKDATEALINAVADLNNSDWKIRENGLQSLESMNNDEAREALTQAINHDYPNVRIGAGWILARTFQDSRSVPSLIEGLTSSVLQIFMEPVRDYSSRMLINLNDTSCLTDVFPLLDDNRCANYVVNILRSMLDNAVPLVRDALVNQPREKIDNILKILQDATMEQIQPDEQLIIRLVELLYVEDLSGFACTILQKIPKEATPHIMNALESNLFELNDNSIDLLREIDDPNAQEIVRKWDDDPYNSRRRASIED